MAKTDREQNNPLLNPSWPTDLNARGQGGFIINITKITEKELEIQQQQRQADLQVSGLSPCAQKAVYECYALQSG